MWVTSSGLDIVGLDGLDPWSHSACLRGLVLPAFPPAVVLQEVQLGVSGRFLGQFPALILGPPVLVG